MSKEIKLPPLPEPDINTASHIGQRIVGYTEKTVKRLRLEAVEADRAERQGEAVCRLKVKTSQWSGLPKVVVALPSDPESVPVYTHPAQQPLSEREIELIDRMIQVQLDHAACCDTILSRSNGNHKMAENQKGWDMERVTLLRKLKAAHSIGGEKP